MDDIPSEQERGGPANDEFSPLKDQREENKELEDYDGGSVVSEKKQQKIRLFGSNLDKEVNEEEYESRAEISKTFKDQ